MGKIHQLKLFQGERITPKIKKRFTIKKKVVKEPYTLDWYFSGISKYVTEREKELSEELKRTKELLKKKKTPQEHRLATEKLKHISSELAKLQLIKKGFQPPKYITVKVPVREKEVGLKEKLDRLATKLQTEAKKEYETLLKEIASEIYKGKTTTRKKERVDNMARTILLNISENHPSLHGIRKRAYGLVILKYLIANGFLEKVGDRVVLTEKGRAIIKK